ncbi:MAG: ATP-binding cassette domain-containing protein [Candidatus Aminicenantes bacterium]|nr:ATP-binding cassette domain-containing protein [Candidatus Aminicenantes bacterium]
MSNVLEIINLKKEYSLPRGKLCVFEDINFSLKKNELISIMGISGVGKTTFLNLCGALDRPSKGKILIEGEDINTKGQKQKAEIRNKKIGFIFQFYHLLPEFNAQENVSFPLLIRGISQEESNQRALNMLREVYLKDKALVRVSQLSGGEQQRVAIARALINEPSILLADEPTGNMDWKTGEKILKLITELHRRKELSSIIVTHNEKIAQFCDKIFLMEDKDLKLFNPS